MLEVFRCAQKSKYKLVGLAGYQNIPELLNRDWQGTRKGASGIAIARAAFNDAQKKTGRIGLGGREGIPRRSGDVIGTEERRGVQAKGGRTLTQHLYPLCQKAYSAGSVNGLGQESRVLIPPPSQLQGGQDGMFGA